MREFNEEEIIYNNNKINLKAIFIDSEIKFSPLNFKIK